MKIEVIVDKDVAKLFGIKLDDKNRPKRTNTPCGQIELKRPKGVPEHIQKKFVRLLDVIECEGIIRPTELKKNGFDVGRLEPSPYVKWAVEIAQNLIFRFEGLKVSAKDVRLLKVKLSRDYRVTLGLVYRWGETAIIFVLVVDGGKREDYYQ